MVECGHNEFDALILRTLLIDGEAFIRIHRDAPNPFGISFELIDSAAIDFTKRREATANLNAIILGVEVDKYYKPVAYYIKPGNITSYQVGTSERVDAKDIIHLFKREFPQQVRGIPPFNSVLEDIKQIQDYRIAELMAAKTSACLSIFYERNNQSSSGSPLDEDDNDENGEFIQSLEPGIASVVQTGYNVKSVAPTHPNNGFGEFNKSILKQVSSSLGISYAKLLKDYEAVNYSSLREGTLDEAAFYAEFQSFLINTWKEVELKLFIDSILLNYDTSLKPTQVHDLIKYHTWICQKRPYFDKSKDIIAEKYALELGIKSPIMLLEEEGRDTEEVLKSWALWNSLTKKYDLNFNDGNNNNEEAVESTEEDAEEIANKERKL